jgi:biotin carboxyl carrier protein
MNEPTLIVSVEGSETARPCVLAPAVGWWSSPPHDGAVVGPGSSVGRLRCLNREYVLRMPEGEAGTVDLETAGHVRAVAFREVLFRLRPLGEERAGVPGPAAAKGGGGRDLPRGAHAVCAPTDGVFYRRPAPDAPAFVEVGSRVRAGQAVGLVEVMKTFNQIVYGGAGLPEEVEIIEVRCEDGAEVAAGQPLLIVR